MACSIMSVLQYISFINRVTGVHWRLLGFAILSNKNFIYLFLFIYSVIIT